MTGPVTTATAARASRRGHVSVVVVAVLVAAVAAGLVRARPVAAATAGPGVSVLTTFDGAQRFNVGPPDTSIAAGPKSIVEIVNSQINVFSRTAPHTLLFQQYSCKFFETTRCSDPRVVYDRNSGRFFAAALTESPGGSGYDGITVAVSATSDPAGTWYRQTILQAADQPRLAVTTDKVIVGDNGDDIWVLQKSDLVAATSEPVAARTVHFLAQPDLATGATVGGITVEAGTADGPDGYAVSRGGTDRTSAYINRITGTPASRNVKLTGTVLHVPYPWQDPVNAVQKGGPDMIPEDFYPKQATLAAGSLWYSMTEPCTPAGDTAVRDCVHLVQIEVTGSRPTLVQEVQIGIAGRYLIDPAVEVDNHGRAVVVATEAGADMYLSVVAIPVRADGVVGAPTVLRAGQSYIDADEAAPGQIRWGDYSSAAVDPLDPSKLWLGGEFALSKTQWGTSISQVTVTDPGCPQVSGCQPGTYRPLPPTRLLDTRSGQGAAKHAVSAGGLVHLPVTGHAGIPATGVAAVAVNLTVTGATGAGYLRAWGDGLPEPATSNLNYLPGRSTASLAIVPVGADGRIVLRNGSTGTAHLIADVTGYYLNGRALTPGAYTPLPAARLLDTRTGLGAANQAVPAGATVRLHVTGTRGVPTTGVSAAALTVTAVSPHRAGHVDVYPDGRARPTASTVNFPAGRTVANLAVTAVGSGGYVDLYNASPGTVQLVADVTGYYRAGTATATGAFTPTVPTRLLDTRTGRGAPAQPLAAGRTITLHISGTAGVPSGATSATVNLTVTAPQGDGYLTTYPAGSTPPATSNINFTANQTVANLTTTRLTGNGDITIANHAAAPVQVIADLTGYTH